MNCIDARDALLIAEIVELRGESDTPLAEHIRTCAECSRAAAAIVVGTNELRTLARGRAPARPFGARSLLLYTAVPIAAALIVAVAIKSRGKQEDVTTRTSLGAPSAARHVSLEVARGQHATVLKTADPNVTVIWLSSGEGK